jgi:hypothetical protein
LLLVVVVIVDVDCVTAHKNPDVARNLLITRELIESYYMLGGEGKSDTADDPVTVIKKAFAPLKVKAPTTQDAAFTLLVQTFDGHIPSIRCEWIRITSH